DPVDVLLRARDRPHGGVDHLVPAHHELVLEVDVRRRDEDVYPGALSVLDRPDGAVDVLLARAGERQHDRARDRLGDAAYRLEVTSGGRREARLDDVDAEMLELACDRELLLDVHGGARRLLAVAERGVEDPYPVHRRSPLCQPGRENTWGHEPPGPWPQKTKT